MDWDLRRDQYGDPETPEVITPDMLRSLGTRGRHAGYKPDPWEGLRGWAL